MTETTHPDLQQQVWPGSAHPLGSTFDGEFDQHSSLFSYDVNAEEPGTGRNEEDSLGHTMLSVVINPFFDWGDDRAPKIPDEEMVIYECHVKGMTQTHPGIPEQLRGTYAGMAHPVMVDYLTDLGVTSIELLPVHQFLQDAVSYTHLTLPTTPYV